MGAVPRGMISCELLCLILSLTVLVLVEVAVGFSEDERGKQKE